MKRTGLLLLTAFTLILSGCDFFLGPDKLVKNGNLTISIGEGRSVTDEAAKTFRYEFDFLGPEGESRHEELSPGTLSINISVSPGDWIIAAKAFTVPGDILVGIGSVTHKVTPGQNLVTVPMTERAEYSAKEITGFAFPIDGASEAVIDNIDETAGTITVTVPHGTDMSNIAPAFTIPVGASVDYPSGTARDFSVLEPVTYTVTAADGSSRIYTVMVNPEAGIVDAQTPAISEQPQGALYTQNAAASPLAVTASVGDSGDLSYQWYSNSTNSNSGGTPLGSDSGAQTATYTPPTSAIGTVYYYVVITNTNTSVNGTPIASKTSNTAAVTVDVGLEFSFTVRTTVLNESFAIPTSGNLNGSSTIKSYDWNINWGDGFIEKNKTGNSGLTSGGITHSYTAAGDYRITIMPAGTNQAWLGAFGFHSNTSGANAQTNKDKVVSVDSKIYPLMTRTTAQISGTPPHNEWVNTFYGCKNDDFTMGPLFGFAAEWNGITTVGNSFASSMFSGCSGVAFTMSPGFNLPTGITTVGSWFASGMFTSCSGVAFTMSPGFNLPAGITTVGDSFAYGMFYGCSGADFTMSPDFNLPAGITTVGDSFADSMFYGCSGAAFTMISGFNLPTGITTVGGSFAYGMFYGCSGDAFTMISGFNLPAGITTVGNYFAYAMFRNCSGDAFTMSPGFNLPTGITTVGDNFASDMFWSCSGDAFTMSPGFNLPTGITTVGDNFASLMFAYCSGDAFTMISGFNLPTGITTVGGSFAEGMFTHCSGNFQVNAVFKFIQFSALPTNAYLNTFRLEDSFLIQTRTASSIINGNPDPGSDLNTFGPSAKWDLTGVDPYWIE